MPHFLGYHNLINGEDFINSDFYAAKQIEAIPDPEAGNTTKPPTSIPSPFAAMDLTRTAFRRLAEREELRGDKIDQKLVSLCWDVGEVFFNSSTLDELNIMSWDRENDLRKLLDSPEQSGHRILGDTIKMFLEQDAETYNFEQLDHLYMLNYKYRVIGGTSSSTLFFSTLNPIEQERDLHIKLGSDYTLFDDNYCPLYLRDNDFQIFIYNLRKAIPHFTTKFREVNDYLEKNLEILRRRNVNLYNSIQTLSQESYYDRYADLPLSNTSGAYVTIFNVPLRRKKQRDDGQSDFKIDSQKYSGRLPLVLKKGFGGKTNMGGIMTYFDCPYDKDIDSQIPHYHPNSDIEDRVLPGLTGQKYPYLLISDLFEDSIIRLNYPINSDKYFNGNLVSEDYGFLLPLKKEIFKYFDVDFLLFNKMDDGKTAFSLEERGNGGVKATLRIPVTKGYIEYERLYMPPVGMGQSEPDLNRNQGGMKQILVGVNIFPFVQTKGTEVSDDYRIQLVTTKQGRNFVENRLQLFSIDSSEPIQSQAIQKRSNIQDHNYGTDIYIVRDTFDYIELTHGGFKGLIIPKWNKYGIGGSDQYHFSIDFGTTNTHIEYNVNGGVAKSFDIKSSEIQVGVLHDPVYVKQNREDDRNLLEESLLHEFMPIYLDADLHHKFPQRTVLIESKNLNLDQATYTLADFNIPFIYEREAITAHNRVSTNLKWSNYIQDENDKKRVESYLENLILLIKAKVLINDGNLKQTKLTWFYPSSMLPNRRDELETSWDKFFKTQISKENPPVKLSESLAPFYHYSNNLNVGAMTRPAISIDIGGGTTDFVIFYNNQPKHLSSFRFAANSVFGDAYSSSPDINGFVNKYQPAIEKLLENNNLLALSGTLRSILRTNKSEDIIAFFISLESNRTIIERNLPISFQAKLKDDQNLKLVILLFFAAIIYHIAKYMKFHEVKQPRNIIFSGNGSKVLDLLDSSRGSGRLGKLSSIIFQKVYELDETPKIEIKKSEEPKKVTCKGGLLYNASDADIDSIKGVLSGIKNEQHTKLRYPDINDEVLTSVIDEFVDFINMFFDIHGEYNFFHNFSVNAAILDESQEKLTDREELLEYLTQGIEQKKRELFGNVKIELEETLFFYPLIGAMNALTYELSQK